MGAALLYMLATAPRIDWLSGGGRGMWTSSYSVMAYPLGEDGLLGGGRAGECGQLPCAIDSVFIPLMVSSK